MDEVDARRRRVVTITKVSPDPLLDDRIVVVVVVVRTYLSQRVHFQFALQQQGFSSTSLILLYFFCPSFSIALILLRGIFYWRSRTRSFARATSLLFLTSSSLSHIKSLFYILDATLILPRTRVGFISVSIRLCVPPSSYLRLILASFCFFLHSCYLG